MVTSIYYPVFYGSLLFIGLAVLTLGLFMRNERDPVPGKSRFRRISRQNQSRQKIVDVVPVERSSKQLIQQILQSRKYKRQNQSKKYKRLRVVFLSVLGAGLLIAAMGTYQRATYSWSIQKSAILQSFVALLPVEGAPPLPADAEMETPFCLVHIHENAIGEPNYRLLQHSIGSLLHRDFLSCVKTLVIAYEHPVEQQTYKQKKKVGDKWKDGEQLYTIYRYTTDIYLYNAQNGEVFLLKTLEGQDFPLFISDNSPFNGRVDESAIIRVTHEKLP